MKHFLGKGRIIRWIEVIVVWIVLARIFGVMSHMAFFGIGLMAQLLMYQMYEQQKESKGDTRVKRFWLAGLTGLVTLASAVNAFWAEYDAWWFKTFMVLFWLFCNYGALRMYRETSKLPAGKGKAAIGRAK